MTNPMNSLYARIRNASQDLVAELPAHLRAMFVQEMTMHVDQLAAKEERQRPSPTDVKAKSLHDRCREFLDMARVDAITRTGSPVDDLVAFVTAERGRTADPVLEETLPLVLYFADDDDREEFIGALKQAKPGMRSKRLP